MKSGNKLLRHKSGYTIQRVRRKQVFISHFLHISNLTTDTAKFSSARYWGYSQRNSTIKQNPSAYEKYEYRHLGSCDIQSTLHKWFLNWNKIFKKNNKKKNKKEVVTRETPFFTISPFCISRSICVNIGFWQGNFVWKCCVFNLSTFKQHTSTKKR